jgi:hypothetical protein
MVRENVYILDNIYPFVNGQLYVVQDILYTL